MATQETRVFRSTRTGYQVDLWLAPTFPLSSRDYADAIRWRLQKPLSTSDEQFLSEIAKLPGYPILSRTIRGKRGAMIVDNTVVSAEQADLSRELFEIPANYKRVNPTTVILERHNAKLLRQDLAAKRQQARSGFCPKREYPAATAFDGRLV